MRVSIRNTAVLALASQGLLNSIPVGAFQPSRNLHANGIKTKSTRTKLPVAAPLQAKEVEQASFSNNDSNNNGKKKYRIQKKKSNNNKKMQQQPPKNEKKEFTWLYWLYKQWHSSPVAHVDKSILQQFLPAAQSWKSKQSWLGARRANELVERYCIEYMAGNPHADVMDAYFVKLLRAGLDAWLQCTDEAEPFQKAQELLDDLMVLSDRAIHDNDNNSETVARAKLLQSQVQEQRVILQGKTSKLNYDTDIDHGGQELSLLLQQSMAFTEGRTTRHLEDSLVAMQQTVVSLDRKTEMNNNQLMDALERELVFTLPEQELLLQSAEWLSIALPFWEFLHHSLIRGLMTANEPERAERSFHQMQAIARKSMSGEYYAEQQDAKSALPRIIAMEREGTDLLKRIKKDKQFQWLHWLSHQLSISPPGEVSESVLKSVMPAMSMHAKRKTKQDAQQAEELLTCYVDEFRAGNPHANLTNHYFNCVCDAWAKLGDPKRAQAILNDMVQLKQEHPDNPNIRPDVYSFSTLAAAWANNRSPEAAKRAEQILQRMEKEGMDPTTITYNTVLRALIHSPGVSKAMRAEEIVRRMEKRYEAGHTECKPSIRTYQSLISAWSRTDLSGTAQKGEQVLTFLDTKSKENGCAHLAPNAHCFAAAIHGWAYSDEEQKARRAYNILSHMRDLYEQQGRKDCQPNVVVYTAVINACASPCLESEKEGAFQIAKLAMDELCYNRRYGWPNFLTFASFLRVCDTTLEPGSEKDDIVRSVFSRCREAGQVADVVVEKLKRAASEELYQELMIDTGAESSDSSLNLPRGWTRRVQGAQSRAKPTRKSRKNRPEFSRMHEVRLLKGTAGHYSKNKGEKAISITFEEGTL